MNLELDGFPIFYNLCWNIFCLAIGIIRSKSNTWSGIWNWCKTRESIWWKSLEFVDFLNQNFYVKISLEVTRRLSVSMNLVLICFKKGKMILQATSIVNKKVNFFLLSKFPNLVPVFLQICGSFFFVRIYQLLKHNLKIWLIGFRQWVMMCQFRCYFFFIPNGTTSVKIFSFVFSLVSRSLTSVVKEKKGLQNSGGFIDLSLMSKWFSFQANFSWNFPETSG